MWKNNKIVTAIRSRIPQRSNLLGQFMRYFVVGGLASVADFGVFGICVYLFDVHYLVSNLFGLAVGNVVNYLLSMSWVFATEKRRMEKRRFLEIVVFVSIGVLGLAFNEGLMYVFVGKAAMHEMLAKVVAAAIVLLWNFGARKVVLFRSSKENA